MNKTDAFLRTVLTMALIIFCLLATFVAAGIFLLPKAAEISFGLPSPYLSPTQRVVYSIRLLANDTALHTPLDPTGQQRTFVIPMGESVNAIAARLEGEGFINGADILRTYLVYSGMDTTVQAGEYRISPAMTPLEIAAALQDATPAVVDFAILPGWRAEEIAASLPTSGLSVTPEEFLAVVNAPSPALLPPGVQSGSLEGFLMPGMYEVPREISAADLAGMFVRRFAERIPQNVLENFSVQGLDLRQAVTLASVVEREAVVDEEQALIASVFFNRLAAGMMLESDPTVQYALGYQPDMTTWWKNPLSTNDLSVNSSYNTYNVPGLPPGPICNPGLDALHAVAYPAQTGYFFFRAQCDGSGRHFFAVTYEEHLNNACP